LRSVKECALNMGVTEKQVRAWQEDGSLPYTKIGSGTDKEKRLSSFHDCDVCMWNTKHNKDVYRKVKGSAIA